MSCPESCVGPAAGATGGLCAHRQKPLISRAATIIVTAPHHAPNLRASATRRSLEVSVAEIEAARRVLPIVSVQNEYNLGNRKSEAVLDYCEAEGLAFIPWYPLDAGRLAGGGLLAEASEALGATPSQVALAWLLARSRVMLPIPGTSTVAHLDENVAAATVEMTGDWFERLDGAAREA